MNLSDPEILSVSYVLADGSKVNVDDFDTK